jgi:hypothetical protein
VAAFLANVGVNASHRLRSPLLPDGAFTLLPIPEHDPWRPPMLRLIDLPHVAPNVPPRWLETPVHHDPDLTSTHPTYGDNCRRAARAYSLRQASAGDSIHFVASLHDGTRAAFHLVGVLQIAEILADVEHDPGPGWWDANAHIRRARATGRWDCFWVFRGGSGSRLHRKAIPFNRPQAESIFDAAWQWPSHRTEMQTLASHTRAIRRLDGTAEVALEALAAG